MSVRCLADLVLAVYGGVACLEWPHPDGRSIRQDGFSIERPVYAVVSADAVSGMTFALGFVLNKIQHIVGWACRGERQIIDQTDGPLHDIDQLTRAAVRPLQDCSGLLQMVSREMIGS